MLPHFTGICLISGDVPALTAFYSTLLSAQVQGDHSFAIVSSPVAVLSVFSIAGMEAMVPGSMAHAGSGNFTIEFEVDDVDARYDQLRSGGVQVLKPPTTQPWGRRSMWLRDPDGNIVNFYQRTAATAEPSP